MGQKSAGYIVT